jgi:hypothetical protein
MYKQHLAGLKFSIGTRSHWLSMPCLLAFNTLLCLCCILKFTASSGLFSTSVLIEINTLSCIAPILLFYSVCYCRFQVTFQHAVPKFVANLPITFPSSEIGHTLRNKVRKFISMFELHL